MWTCPKCKESIEDQFDTCWKCAGENQQQQPTKKPWSLWLLVAIAVGLFAGIPLTKFLLQTIDGAQLAHRIANSDHVVATFTWNNSATVTITGESAIKIVQAVSSAKRDTASYASQFDVRLVFFNGTNSLDEVKNCGQLILHNGKQYHVVSEEMYPLVIPALKKALIDSTEAQEKSK